jgi:hypothetical protein
MKSVLQTEQYTIFGGNGLNVKFSLSIRFSILIIYYSMILLF